MEKDLARCLEEGEERVGRTGTFLLLWSFRLLPQYPTPEFLLIKNS